MPKRLLSFLLLAVLLLVVSCQQPHPPSIPTNPPSIPSPTSSGSATHSPATVVTFLNRSTLEFANGVEEAAQKNGVSLDQLEIYTLNQKLAFLYSQSDVGSILLRTADVGKHWQEVMQPEFGSVVRHVTFADQNTGWALAEYYWGEAGGPMTVFKTVDTGKTWAKLTDFPLRSRYWSLADVDFRDAKRGTIEIYNYSDESDPKLCVECTITFTTLDGGLTWKETSRNLKSRRGPDNSVPVIKSSQSTGADGTLWQVDFKHENGRITVLGKLPNQDMSIVSSIPVRWRYEKGQILP